MATSTGWTTGSPADQSTEGLPSECGMERMNNHNETRLWRLLEKEKLTDLSHFHEPGIDDFIVVLRQSDIEFHQRDENPANEVHLPFALKYLKSVISYKVHPT